MNAKQIKTAWNKFRKGCRLVSYGGRMAKAWRVPGTREAGRDAQWYRDYNDALRKEKS